MTGYAQDPMGIALALAREAADNNEVPVGAVIAYRGAVIAKAANRMKALGDPTAHAEMLVIRQALDVFAWERLDECDLYVTLEPCAMCACAASHARIRRIYYGADDEKGGAVENGVRFFDHPTCHHRPEVISGLGATASARLLKQFFQSRR